MKNIAVMLFAALLAAGCSVNPFETAKNNVENSKKLRVGMTKGQVLEVMGAPVSGEAFCQPDVWFYQTRTVWADGLTTEDECIPLVFTDGKLSGWGTVYYTHSRQQRGGKTTIPEKL